MDAVIKGDKLDEVLAAKATGAFLDAAAFKVVAVLTLAGELVGKAQA